MKCTTAPVMRGGRRLIALTAALVALACVAVPGCATHNHYQAARPVSATLEIEVQGQWKKVQRTVYEYQENLTGQQPEKESKK